MARTSMARLVSRFLQDDFYVDDGLKAVKSPQDAIDLIKKAQAMCADAGLRLHKFTSNSLEVLETVPQEDRAKNLKDLDLRHDVLPIQRSLGTYWCIGSDSFQFRITLKDKPLTRRGILSTVVSVYDPLGFVSPVILVGKLILRALCQQNADWDDPVPDHILSRWEKWRSELSHLEELQIPRCFKPPDFGKVKSTEIHSFADASQLGIGQVSYLRLVNERGPEHVSFLMGKARVTPIKLMSIPRLELTAAVVSVNVAQQLIQELDYHVDAEVYYSDSTVVISYINSEARRFHVYVGNRVQQIRNMTSPECWHHVKGEDNPADVASRSTNTKELLKCRLWLNGPEFLWQPQLPKRSEVQIAPTIDEDPEVKKVTTFSTKMKPPAEKLDPDTFDYFSSWFKLKKAVALAIQYVRCLRNKISKRINTPATETPTTVSHTTLLVGDLRQAELVILRSVQNHDFREELSVLQALKVGECTDRETTRTRNQKLKQTSSLHRLDPFLDQDGVLRVGGRIRRAEVGFEEKHPAIRPKQSHVTTLVVRHYHKEVQHQGRLMTLNEIRQRGYWIVYGRTTVSNLINKCVTCRRLRSSTETQKMSDLPVDRLREAPPFTYAGVDAFGPWYVKEGRKTLKRYGLLFTCMASRAIHLETLNTMETDSFTCALRRFFNRRGSVRQLRSDRGTNFVGAKRELSQAWMEIDQTKIQEFLLAKSCDWIEFQMNVPSRIPHGWSLGTTD